MSFYYLVCCIYFTLLMQHSSNWQAACGTKSMCKIQTPAVKVLSWIFYCLQESLRLSVLSVCTPLSLQNTSCPWTVRIPLSWWGVKHHTLLRQNLQWNVWLLSVLLTKVSSVLTCRISRFWNRRVVMNITIPYFHKTKMYKTAFICQSADIHNHSCKSIFKDVYLMMNFSWTTNKWMEWPVRKPIYFMLP